MTDIPVCSTDWGFWGLLARGGVSVSQQSLLELGTKGLTSEGHFLSCYWTPLIEAAPVTKGQKLILKPEIAIVYRMMSEKPSNGDGSAQKSRKKRDVVYTGSRCLGNTGGDLGSGEPLYRELTLEWGVELRDYTATCTAPYKLVLADQQSCSVCGRQSQGEQTAFCLQGRHSDQTKEG